MKDFEMIPIAEYARLHCLDPSTVRQKCLRGGWITANKIGRDWFIDPDEPHVDLRKKSMKDKKDEKYGDEKI